MSEKRQERTVSKLAIQKAHHLKAASSSFVPFCLKKDQKKKFGQFFGRFHREGASSFFGSDPPRVFHFPWGGVEPNPQINGPPLTPISYFQGPPTHISRPAKSQESRINSVSKYRVLIQFSLENLIEAPGNFISRKTKTKKFL